jgi:hypothetical protein
MRRLSAGQAEGGETFLIVPLSVIACFTVLITLGDRQHQAAAGPQAADAPGDGLAPPRADRAAVNRLGMEVAAGPATAGVARRAGFLSELPAGRCGDGPRLAHARTAPFGLSVYLITAPILLAVPLAVMPISDTAAWHGFAKAFAALAGTAPVKVG